MHAQGHVVHRVGAAVARGREPVDLEQQLADLAPVVRARVRVQLASDHQRGERLARRGRRVHGRHGAAVAQDGDAVGHRHHLVELVRDEDDGAPVVGHRPQRPEQVRRLLRGQDGGRLVEDQDPGLAIERLQDLDPLLLADGELPDPRAGIHRHAVALAELRHALLDRARVQAEGAPQVARVAEHDVLGDRERLHEPEVLVHHADPRLDPVARGVEGDGRAVDLELSLVGAVEAGEDVREGALAGAVLTEESVHLALERLEVDAVVGDDAREALRDPAARDRRACPRARGGDRLRLRRGLHGRRGRLRGSGRAAPPAGSR